MMKNMKRIIAIMLVLVMGAMTFTACTKKDEGFNTSKNISVTAREDGSGTKSAFMELMGLKGKADPSGIVIGTGTAAVLTEVKGNPYAIAYESLGYVTDEVKMIKVDGVEATIENIKAGKYKISRPLSIVYKEATLTNEINKAFYEFIASKKAQEIILKKGYVSVVDDAKEYEINGSLSGKIDISGSTSLQPLMIELADEFKKLQPNVTINIAGGGSGTGYKNAENGTSAFGMISEEFLNDKAPACKSYEVAKDGIAVIINKSNTLNDITMDQLKGIYNAENQVNKKWSDIIK